MPDDRLPVQFRFGQLSGPGIKGHPSDLWQTAVHKALSGLSSEEVQAYSRQTIFTRQLTATMHLDLGHPNYVTIIYLGVSIPCNRSTDTFGNSTAGEESITD